MSWCLLSSMNCDQTVCVYSIENDALRQKCIREALVFTVIIPLFEVFYLSSGTRQSLIMLNYNSLCDYLNIHMPAPPTLFESPFVFPSLLSCHTFLQEDVELQRHVPSQSLPSWVSQFKHSSFSSPDAPPNLLYSHPLPSTLTPSSLPLSPYPLFK